MKSVVSIRHLLFGLLLFLSLFPLGEEQALADLSGRKVNTVTVSLPDTTAGPGSKILIPVYIDDATGLAGAEILIAYDPEVLTALGAEVTALTSRFLLADSVKPGMVAVSISNARGLTRGKGSIVEISFQVNPDATLGETTPLILKKVLLYDVTTRPITVQKVDGQLTVKRLIIAGWRYLGPDEFVVYAIAVDPQNSGVIYAGTEKGLFKTTDGGSNWIPTRLEKPVFRLVTDPVKPAVLYALTEDGIYKSTDSGESWTYSFFVHKGYRATALALAPSKPQTIYAAEYSDDTYTGFLFRSTDGGLTWKLRQKAPFAVTTLVVDPDNPSIVYAGLWTDISTAGEIDLSVDGGINWSPLVITGVQISSIAIDPMDTRVLYAGSLGEGVYKSQDGGLNWSRIGPSPTGEEISLDVTSVIIDPSDTEVLYAGTDGKGVYRSRDGGSTWTTMNRGLTNLSVLCLALAPEGSLYAGTGGNGVFGYLARIIPIRPQDIEVSPASLDFGGVKVDSVAYRMLKVSNAGGATLEVTDISSDSRLFTPDPTAFTLSPGESKVVKVTFRPISQGRKEATLTITSNDPDEGRLTVPLSGIGLAPDITLSAEAHDFGDVAVDSSSTWVLVISNEGNADLVISNISSNDPQFTVSPSSFTVLAGKVQKVAVTFMPTSIGSKKAVLAIKTNDPDEKTVTVSLIGMGSAPDISLSEISHDFGSVLIDTPSAWTLTVSNLGNAVLSVYTVTSSSPEFVASPASFKVEAGGSVGVTVTFKPTSLGPKSADLTIVSDDPDEPRLQVKLTGSGVPVPEPDINLSAVSIDFGNVPIDSLSSWTLVVSNLGGLVLSVQNIESNDPDFSITPVSFEVPKGGSVKVTVTYSPSSAGSKTATLTITTNDPDESILSVTLIGTGLAPDISLSDTSHDFGTVPVDSSATWVLTTSNHGNALLNVSINSDSPEFMVTPDAFNVPAGGSQEVTVEFSPVSGGWRSATLTVTSNDPDEPTLAVTLEGFGEVPNQPPSLTIEPIEGLQSGDITIRYVLSDQEGDTLSITCFYSADGGRTWDPATVQGKTEGILPAEYSGSILWKSEVDLPGVDLPNVRFRIEPRDANPGAPDETAVFHLDNNLPPSLTFTEVPQEAARDVIISYQLSDPEGDQLRIIPEYSVDGGVNWSGATITGDTTGIPPADYSGNITWRTFEDLGYGRYADVRFRITPWDNDQGTPAATDPFGVRNMAGDYDGDLDIDFDDLTIFLVAWDELDLTKEIGPASGEVPDLIPQPDGALDFEDLAVFVLMWNWSAKGIGKLARPLMTEGHSIRASFDPEESRVYIRVDTEGLEGLLAAQLIVEYDPSLLKCDDIMEGDIFSANRLFLKKVDPENGVVVINTGRLGGTSFNGRLITALKFERLADGAGEISIEYDLRGRKGERLEAGRMVLSLETISAKYDLMQNRPNPFNTRTTIGYSLPEAGYVRLRIYNTLGQEIKTLVDGPIQAGHHSVIWDSRDESGQEVTSGVYIYQIAVRPLTSKRLTFSRSRRLILLK